MSVNYYTANNTNFLPSIVDYGILPTVRYMICSYLYPTEMEETYYDTLYKQELPIAFKRFVLADITGNPDSAMKRRDKIIKTNNSDLPYTAYAIGDFEEDLTNVNHSAKSYNYTSKEMNTRVSARPLKFQIPMISFFSTSHDYYWAISRLHDLSISLTRYFAPISINGDTAYIPFDFEFEITKGQYADAFEEQLRVGRIQDIMHTGTVSFMDFSFPEGGGVYPVDSILYSLREYYDKQDLTQNKIYTSQTITALEPTITTNTGGQSGVSTTTDTVFTFSERMNVTSFVDKIVTIPRLFYTESWNSGESVLTLGLYENMLSGTAYTVSLASTIQTYENRSLAEDFEIEFTTI